MAAQIATVILDVGVLAGILQQAAALMAIRANAMRHLIDSLGNEEYYAELTLESV